MTNLLFVLSFNRWNMKDYTLHRVEINFCDYDNAKEIAKQFSLCQDCGSDVDVLDAMTGEIYCTISKGTETYEADR